MTLRYYVTPSAALPGGLSLLNFDNETVTWPSQMQGRLDGENAVKDGEGMMQAHFIEYQNNATMRAQYPKVSDFIQGVV